MCFRRATAYDKTAVYTCAGNPHPSDIELVVNSMMTDEFGTCHQSEVNSVCIRSALILFGSPQKKQTVGWHYRTL